MIISKFTKKVMVVAVLGLSLMAAQILGAGAGSAHAATTSNVTSSQVNATAYNSKAANIVNLALSLRGKVRYVYGVNNPNKLTFDCSSFTKYVFAKNGVSLKWGSRSQAKQGTYVSKSNLMPGDLVFFSVGSSSRIGHVGIYIGGGQFVHNTKGSKWNGVRVDDLSDYSKRYITARRVL